MERDEINVSERLGEEGLCVAVCVSESIAEGIYPTIIRGCDGLRH